MELKFTDYDFIALLGRLSVANSVEKVNDNIVHIKFWHNEKIFRARFVKDDNCDYMFTNFLEG